jgi:hypothetical protein
MVDFFSQDGPGGFGGRKGPGGFGGLGLGDFGERGRGDFSGGCGGWEGMVCSWSTLEIEAAHEAMTEEVIEGAEAAVEARSPTAGTGSMTVVQDQHAGPEQDPVPFENVAGALLPYEGENRTLLSFAWMRSTPIDQPVQQASFRLICCPNPSLIR